MVKTRVIRLRVIANPNAQDQIAFRALPISYPQSALLCPAERATGTSRSLSLTKRIAASGNEIGALHSFFSGKRSFIGHRLTSLRPEAKETSGEAARKNTLAKRALIYRAGWTLTLSLICQSNRRSQANSKVITKGGTKRCSTKSHIISTMTSLSFNKNLCF